MHPGIDLEAAWGLRPDHGPVADALVEAYRKLGSAPLQAARVAERVFPEAAERGDLLPWLAFVVAVGGRIQSLSDFHGLDPLIAYAERYRTALDAPQPVLDRVDACIFGGLVFRRPDHPRMAFWARRCAELAVADGSRDAGLRLAAANYLILYRIWCGDLTGAEALASRAAALREQSADVHARLLCHSINSMIQRLFLHYEECRREIKQGLALGHETGVHVWDSHFHMQGAFLALTRENLAEAREWLELMVVSADPEHYLDRSGYHYCRGWLHTLQAELTLAIRHARESVRLAQRSGAVFPQAITHVGLAQLYLEQRSVGNGLYHLLQARRIGRRMEAGGLPVQFIRGLLTAHISFRLGMERRALRALAQAFRIGREQHYLNFPWWRADLVAGLCARALDADVETAYALTLIRLRRLRPPVTLKRRERWYYPLQVNLLGDGEASMDGQPLALGRQPRVLLLALCALADQDGWVARERLMELLWPGTRTEQARRALDRGIHRLRRKLGTERLIRERPDALGLDPDFCQVDYWRLRQALGRRVPEAADLALLTDALERCTSPGRREAAELLPLDTLPEHIVDKALSVLHFGGVSEEEACAWLERLLQARPASERLWQALVRRYVGRGMIEQAMGAWERCCEALRQEGMAQPSPALRVLIGQAGRG
ncbi:MAG: hypothetical protein JJT90_06155 [Ectothiorhodospiraceae bacterium]|nr:hypothetical protein [Ectothiorhodospiraceae bacterium]